MRERRVDELMLRRRCEPSSRLRVGDHAWTGSTIHSRSSASRSGRTVALRRLLASPPVAASRIVSYEAVVDDAAAYAVNHRRNAAGLRTVTPSSGKSRSVMRSRYPSSCARSASVGQSAEPRKAGSAGSRRRSREASARSLHPASVASPWRSSARLTVAVATPRSTSVIGRMRTVTIRPAPEWVVASKCWGWPIRSAGSEPGAAPDSSTARRTRSHAAGTRCHSSIRIGRSPSRSRAVIGLDDAPLCLVIEPVDGARTPRRGDGLPDRLRPFDRERGETAEQRVQLVVDDAAGVRAWRRR